MAAGDHFYPSAECDPGTYLTFVKFLFQKKHQQSNDISKIVKKQNGDSLNNWKRMGIYQPIKRYLSKQNHCLFSSAECDPGTYTKNMQKICLKKSNLKKKQNGANFVQLSKIKAPG